LHFYIDLFTDILVSLNHYQSIGRRSAFLIRTFILGGE
jgi:hypothetical protein